MSSKWLWPNKCKLGWPGGQQVECEPGVWHCGDEGEPHGKIWGVSKKTGFA